MSDYRMYQIRDQYLLEIDYEYYSAANKEPIVDTWNWEVSLAFNMDVHKGMAIERKRNILVPWTDLSEHNLSDEMYKLCHEKMNQFA